MMDKLRCFYSRYYESMKLGLLVGLLISQIILLNKVNQSITESLRIGQSIENQVEVDNNARNVSRAEADKRHQTIISYLRCIVLLKPEERTPAAVDRCLETGNTPAATQEGITAPVPPAPRNDTVRQSPTTSEPPAKQPATEPEEQSLLEQITEPILNPIRDLLTGKK